MKWPKTDVREPFEVMERRLGITDEVDDIRPSQLGCYPSDSFYCNREEKIELNRMRSMFDKVAARY